MADNFSLVENCLELPAGLVEEDRPRNPLSSCVSSERENAHSLLFLIPNQSGRKGGGLKEDLRTVE